MNSDQNPLRAQVRRFKMPDQLGAEWSQGELYAIGTNLKIGHSL
jgi:hypothetical protein